MEWLVEWLLERLVKRLVECKRKSGPLLLSLWLLWRCFFVPVLSSEESIKLRVSENSSVSDIVARLE